MKSTVTRLFLSTMHYRKYKIRGAEKLPVSFFAIRILYQIILLWYNIRLFISVYTFVYYAELFPHGIIYELRIRYQMSFPLYNIQRVYYTKSNGCTCVRILYQIPHCTYQRYNIRRLCFSIVVFAFYISATD